MVQGWPEQAVRMWPLSSSPRNLKILDLKERFRREICVSPMAYTLLISPEKIEGWLNNLEKMCIIPGYIEWDKTA